MQVNIKIDTKYFSYLLIAIAVIATVGIVIAQGTNPGHPWSQIDCSGCISGTHIANNAVTGPKIADAAVTGPKIADAAVSDAKVSAVDWSKISSVPAGLGDGDDNDVVTCTWAGAAVTNNYLFQNCANCCGGLTCNGYCSQSRTDTLTTVCTSGRVTSMSYTTGTMTACTCSGTCFF